MPKELRSTRLGAEQRSGREGEGEGEVAVVWTIRPLRSHAWPGR